MPYTVEPGELEGEIRRLTAELREMERRHGRSTADMLHAVLDGTLYTDPHICEWLDAYDDLVDLEEVAGRAPDSPANFTVTPPVKLRPVKQMDVEAEIRRLTAEVREMERRYGRSSESMLEAVRSGTVDYSNWEICDWLGAYNILKDLEEDAGLETGPRTSATASSTNATSPR